MSDSLMNMATPSVAVAENWGPFDRGPPIEG